MLESESSALPFGDSALFMWFVVFLLVSHNDMYYIIAFQKMQVFFEKNLKFFFDLFFGVFYEKKGRKKEGFLVCFLE